MGLNMLGVDVRELMCEMYCGVMALERERERFIYLFICFCLVAV